MSSPEQRQETPEVKEVFATPAEVDAAKAVLLRREELGLPIPESLRLLAGAETKTEAAPDPTTLGSEAVSHGFAGPDTFPAPRP